jgi:hypothetical protein
MIFQSSITQSSKKALRVVCLQLYPFFSTLTQLYAGEGGSSSSSSEGEQEGFDAQLRIEGDFKCVLRLFPFRSF